MLDILEFIAGIGLTYPLTEGGTPIERVRISLNVHHLVVLGMRINTILCLKIFY